MTFDQRGNLLPYELIQTTLAEIETVFVNALPRSTTRRLIYDAFVNYLTNLQREIKVPIEVWANGSFTTLKPNPDDIDFVIFVDSQVAREHIDIIGLFRVKRSLAGSLTDGYFVESVSPDHPDFRIYEFNRADRYRDFGFDRLNKPKGGLHLHLDTHG